MSEFERRPALVFFPYLPLRRTIAVGPWQLVPTNGFKGPWMSERFEDLSRTFLASFVTADRKPLRSGAIVVDATVGCDGRLVDASTRTALQRAVELAALDSNPTWTEDAQAWNVVTSDNAELHAWPIDLTEGRIALSSGFVASTLSGGLDISSELQVTAPEELHMPLVDVALDEELVNAAYRHALLPVADDRLGRLGDAIGWLAKAWRNTPSLDWNDRVVFLKTGFEALTGSSKTHEAASKLRQTFETVVGPEGTGSGDLLWSPLEAEVRQFEGEDGRLWPCTDLEHWFRTFGSARNAIIHGDADPSRLSYELDGSAYRGPMFHTAERLLRESIKVALAGQGERLIYASELTRAVARHLQETESGG